MKPISPLGVLIVVFSCLMPALGSADCPDYTFVKIADSGELAFSASGSGFSGLFVSEPAGICRVIDTDTPLEGKDVVQLSMGRDSYARGRLGFFGHFFRRQSGYLSCPKATDCLSTQQFTCWRDFPSAGRSKPEIMGAASLILICDPGGTK